MTSVNMDPNPSGIRRSLRGRALVQSLWMVSALSSLAIALFSYRYLASMGPLAPNVMQNLARMPWLDVHVAGAATALLIAPLQIVPQLRGSRVHRWLGRVYVAGCLAGGIAGVFLAFGTTAGPIATLGFACLGVLWIACTAIAWRMAVTRRVTDHKAWMIRSFALTLSAVTLRAYLPAADLFGLPPLASYRAISFLCWVPNILIAEWLLLSQRRRAIAPTRPELAPLATAPEARL